MAKWLQPRSPCAQIITELTVNMASQPCGDLQLVVIDASPEPFKDHQNTPGSQTGLRKRPEFWQYYTDVMYVAIK